MHRLFLYLNLLLGFSVSYSYVLLGIDFGGQYVKASIVAPRKGIEILLNERSQRKVQNTVYIDNVPRLFGDDAIAQSQRTPGSVFQYIPYMLGFNGTDTNVSPPIISSKYYPYEYKIDEDRGSIEFKIGKDENWSTAEEIASHIFSYLKQLVKTATGSTEKMECVLSVPAWYGIRQKEALRDAAYIAEFGVKGIIQENGLAAIHHALDIDFNSLTSPLTKLIVNIGSVTAQACVVSYTSIKKVSEVVPSVTMLGCSFSNLDSGPHIGGHFADLALADYFESEIVGKDDKDGLSLRQRRKILKEAIKAKLMLSSNKVDHVHMESIYQEKDFNYVLKRDEFEEVFAKSIENKTKSKPEDIVYDKIEGLISEAVVNSNLTKFSDFSSLEVIGGGWRMPLILNALERFVQTKENVTLGQRMNSDEAIAMGAGFVAANHSVAFKVPNYWFTESSTHRYHVMVWPKLDAKKQPEDEAQGNDDTRDSDDEIKDAAAENLRVAPTNLRQSFETKIFPAVTGKPAVIADLGEKLTISRVLSFKVNRNVLLNFYEDTNLITMYEISGIDILYKQLLSLKNSLKEKLENEDDRLNQMGNSLRLHTAFSGKSLGIMTLENVYATYKELVYEPPPVVKPLATKKTVTDPLKTNTTDFVISDNSTKIDDEMLNDKNETLTTTVSTDAKESDTTESNTTESDAKESDTKDGDTKESDTTEANTTEANTTEAYTTEANTTEANTPEPIQPAAVGKWKMKKKTHNLQFKVLGQGKPYPLSRHIIDQATVRLREYEKNDEEYRLLEDAKNRLESLVYSTREQITSDSGDHVLTETEREMLREELEKVEDWIYEDSHNATRSQVIEKVNTLLSTCQEALIKISEYKIRDQLVSKYFESMYKLKDHFQILNVTRPWLPTNKTEAVGEYMHGVDTWFNETLSAQTALLPTDMPILKHREVTDKMEKLAKKIETLSKIKEPKPPPEILKPLNVTEVEEQTKNETTAETLLGEKDKIEATETTAGTVFDETDKIEGSETEIVKEAEIKSEQSVEQDLDQSNVENENKAAGSVEGDQEPPPTGAKKDEL